MSWDVFAQDIPSDATCIDDIPEDFEPQPIGQRSSIIAGIRAVAPFVNTSQPDWLVIEGPDFSVEIALGDEEDAQALAFHSRGSDAAAAVVKEILDTLGLRAFDLESESGLFEPAKAEAAMQRWRAYRDRVVGDSS
jgi:hypothetical protein